MKIVLLSEWTLALGRWCLSAIDVLSLLNKNMPNPLIPILIILINKVAWSIMLWVLFAYIDGPLILFL